MKKNIAIIFILIIVVLAVFVTWYLQATNERNTITNYNSEYETLYKDKQITGVDLTTIINKAIDNNEKYSLEKDENSAYIDDGEYYIEIYVKLTEDGDTYLMEAIEQVGLSEFTNLYGSAYFECTNTEYHENGRISKLTFEIVN